MVNVWIMTQLCVLESDSAEVQTYRCKLFRAVKHKLPQIPLLFLLAVSFSDLQREPSASIFPYPLHPLHVLLHYSHINLLFALPLGLLLVWTVIYSHSLLWTSPNHLSLASLWLYLICILNLAKVLCRMPFLTWPSPFILAWDRHKKYTGLWELDYSHKPVTQSKISFWFCNGTLHN